MTEVQEARARLVGTIVLAFWFGLLFWPSYFVMALFIPRLIINHRARMKKARR